MDFLSLLICLPGIFIVILAVFHTRKLTSNRNLIITTRLLQSKSCSKIRCIPPNLVHILTPYVWLRSKTLLYPSTHYPIFRMIQRVIPSLQQISYQFLNSKLDVISFKSNVSPQFGFTCQLQLPKLHHLPPLPVISPSS
jgi:hypothetical protein